MKLIICVDDDGGFAFNNRRQSSDKALFPCLMEILETGSIYMSDYSFKQYGGTADGLVEIDENDVKMLGDEDYFFIEKNNPDYSMLDITGLTVVRWNRAYPSDVHFNFDYSAMELVFTTEFVGNSHEKITVEIYK